MYKSFKKPCLILLSAIIAAMLALACAFMLLPKTTAHADTEEAHDHSTMTDLKSFAGIEIIGGEWYLDEDTHGDIIVGENSEVTICLNGHTLTGSGTGSVITVKEGAKLTLCDCKETGIITGGNANSGGGVYLAGNGTFIMTGGTISGNEAEFYGGGVYLAGNGTFKMTGGTISDNTADAGGGVSVYNGTFTMENGTISGNTASEGGGVSVYRSSTFIMESGTITGNRVAYDGGGVHVYSDSTFIMVNGTISENTAGVYGGGVHVTQDCKFIMSGGSINSNEATFGGGGITIYETCTFTMTGGEVESNSSLYGGVGIFGTFKVSGSPKITGNTGLIDEGTKTVALNVDLQDNAIITVTGALTDGAQIGVNSTGEVATGFTQNDKPSKYFIPDNPEYNCVYLSDETSGAVTVGTHAFAEEFTIDKEPTCAEVGSKSKHCSHCDEKTEVTEIAVIPHTLTHHGATAATEEKEGNKEYWSCEVCGKYFSDGAGKTEITDKSSVILSKLAPAGEPTADTPWWAVLLIVLGILNFAGEGIIIFFLVKKKKGEETDNSNNQ